MYNVCVTNNNNDNLFTVGMWQLSVASRYVAGHKKTIENGIYFQCIRSDATTMSNIIVIASLKIEVLANTYIDYVERMVRVS